MSSKAALVTTSGVVAAMCASVIAAAPAQAQGGTAVTASGACTGHGSWNLEATHDNGRIEIEFQVDVNRVGKTWHVRITDNLQLVTSRDATTLAPSGSFTVRTHTADRVGLDVVRAHATRGDVTCGGKVSL
jgi:hypothetical protein